MVQWFTPRKMAIISPEDQWPPPLPEDARADEALYHMYILTYRHLLEIHDRYVSLLGKTRPKHLILNVQQPPHSDGDRFVLFHGLHYPRKRRKKKAPWFVNPCDSLDMLNNLQSDHAEQIARILCYRYAIDAWDNKLLEEELEEQMNEIDDLVDNEPEPWAVTYEWEKEQEEPDYAYAEEHNEGETFFDDEPDFTIFFAAQTRLQQLYRAVITGTVNEDLIDLTF